MSACSERIFDIEERACAKPDYGSILDVFKSTVDDVLLPAGLKKAYVFWRSFLRFLSVSVTAQEEHPILHMPYLKLIGYWHNNVVCHSVRLSVAVLLSSMTLCTVAT